MNNTKSYKIILTSPLGLESCTNPMKNLFDMTCKTLNVYHKIEKFDKGEMYILLIGPDYKIDKLLKIAKSYVKSVDF